MSEAEIVAAERAVWEALKAGDAAADAALLSEDFLGVYPSGFSGRDGHTEQVQDGPSVAEYRISDEHLRALAEDVILYVYRADYLRTGRDGWEKMLVSSIWERRDGRWINSFSQDTPLSGDILP